MLPAGFCYRTVGGKLKSPGLMLGHLRSTSAGNRYVPSDKRQFYGVSSSTGVPRIIIISEVGSNEKKTTKGDSIT